MRKFVLEKGPFLRSADLKHHNMNNVMYDVVIALIPVCLFGCIYFCINAVKLNLGFYYTIAPFLNVLCGILCSLVFEGLYFYLFKGVKTFKGVLKACVESYAVIPGFILALILPAYTPLYVIVFGTFMANIVFKMLFGGLGHNIFNPALIGYAFCYLSFSKVINEAISLQFMQNASIIVGSATPIKQLLSSDILINLSFKDIFKRLLVVNAGSICEVSGLMSIIGFVYLLVKKVISWKIPVLYTLTVFIVTLIIGFVRSGNYIGLEYPLLSVFSGGLLFGAVFMATEPVTSPTTPNGKVFYSILLGVMTVMIRTVVGIEGVATSILFMCLFTPIIDSYCAKLRGSTLNFKKLIKYGVFVIIILLCVVYTLLKAK